MRVRKGAVTLLALVLLEMVVVNGCALVTVETPVPTPDMTATVEAAVAAALASQPTPDIAATVKAAVATDVAATQAAQAEPVATPTRTGPPTPSPTLPPSVATLVESETVALVTHHGKYVTAMGEGGGWLLRQEPGLSDCGRFTLQYLGGGEVALVTCYNRYVVASRVGDTLSDWALRQEPELGRCGRFILHDLDYGKVAFETCAGLFVTALDSNRPLEEQWLVIGLADKQDAWEVFALQR